MQVPKIFKICLNQGVGQAVGDRKMVDTAIVEMSGHCWPKGRQDNVNKRRF